jgi:hypothetical protein
LSGKMPWCDEFIGWIYGLQGKGNKARCILREAKSRVEKKQYVPTAALAFIHLGLGDTDEFFRLLDRAVEERDALLIWFKYFPNFKQLHSDPRFSSLIHRLGL